MSAAPRSRVFAGRIWPTARHPGFPKQLPCLRCGQLRIAEAAGDRMHERCRAQGDENDGERAAVRVAWW